jgi:hypothetical protein
MAREIIDKCNRCGSARAASNHWWVLTPAPGGGITIQPFDEELLGRNTEIYCGEVCLLARISEIISVSRRPAHVAA